MRPEEEQEVEEGLTRTGPGNVFREGPEGYQDRRGVCPEWRKRGRWRPRR